MIIIIEKLKKVCKKVWRQTIVLLKMLLNWRFAICFGIAWLITNGWAYIFMIVGQIFSLTWLFRIGTAYIAFLWLPITPEKIITFSIAITLQKKLFPKDHVTSNQIKLLQEEHINSETTDNND